MSVRDASAKVEPDFVSSDRTDIGGSGRPLGATAHGRNRDVVMVATAIPAGRWAGLLRGDDNNCRWLEVLPRPHRPSGSGGLSAVPVNTADADQAGIAQ